MELKIGELVKVKLSKKSLANQNLFDNIKECYRDTWLVGKVVYQTMSKQRVALEFAFYMYTEDTVIPSKSNSVFNGFGKSKHPGYCIYLEVKNCNFDDTTKQEAVIAKDLKSVSEGYMLSYDPYNPLRNPQTKEERNSIKSMMYGLRYGGAVDPFTGESNLGICVIKPRRSGLSAGVKDFADFFKLYQNTGYMYFGETREICTNGLNLESVDWEEPISLQELSILGSSYEADQIRSGYRGWKHRFNQESRRYKDPHNFNWFETTVAPEMSDAMIASTWAALLQPGKTLHDFLGLKKLQPYGDEEVLLCPS